MSLSKYELLRKVAGFILATANAGIREEKKNIIIKNVIIKNKRSYIKKK